MINSRYMLFINSRLHDKCDDILIRTCRATLDLSQNMIMQLGF